MTTLNPMSKIVRQLKGGETLAHGERVKRVTPPATSLLRIPKALLSARRYGVTVNVETDPISSTLTLRDGLLQRHVVFRIHWYAKLLGDGTNLLSKLVVSDDSPQQVVESLMIEWINERAKDRGKTQLNHWVYGQSDAIVRELPRFLRKYDLEIRCDVEKANLEQKGVSLGTFTVEARPRDSSRDIKLVLDIFIDPGEAPRELAPKHVGDWQTLLKKAAIEYVRRNETLEAYYRDGRLTTRIHAHLQTVVAEQGWRITGFELRTFALPENTSISANFDVPWTSIAGEKFSFKVKVSLEIAPGGIHAFDVQGWPDLTVWTRKYLGECFDKVLFHRDKDKLSPMNFDDVREALEKEMSAIAARFGLKVNMLVPDPDLPQWKYLSAREYTVKAADYQTHDAGHTVNFDMTVTGYFSAIGAVFRAEKTGESLEVQIEREAIAAATGQMRLEEPKTYYAAFMPPPLEMESPPPPPKNGYLQTRLVAVVKEALWEKFEFEATSVHVLRQDPKIRERLRVLCNELPREFVVKVLPAQHRGDDHQMTMTVALQFLAPPQEYMAQLMAHELSPAQLVEQVRGKIFQILNGMPKEELAFAAYDEAIKLRARLTEEVSKEMRYRGLAVTAENVTCEMSVADRAEYESTEGKRIKIVKLGNALLDKKVAHIMNMTDAVHTAELENTSKERLQDPRDVEDASRSVQKQINQLKEDAARLSGLSAPDTARPGGQLPGRKNKEGGAS